MSRQAPPDILLAQLRPDMYDALVLVGGREITVVLADVAATA